MSDLLLGVVLITPVQEDKQVGTATGFFYRAGNGTLYLITNRHVVADEGKSYKPDVLRLRLHADAVDLTKNVERDIPLYVDGKPRWHVHPDFERNPVDVAVIELDQAFSDGVAIKAFGASHVFPSTFLMQPGEDVIVVGFPRGLSDTAHNLPLVRNALVSSAYGVNFDNQRMFLVDANLHPGMSGSPVLTKPKNFWATKDGTTTMLSGSPTYFLGVFSASLTVNVSGKDEALGLGAVWYGDLINEIISSVP